MTTETMTKLAERCEAAKRPDRELDFAILCLVDPRAAETGLLPGDPEFTASLDAVMKLEPEGLESEEVYPPGAECPVWTSHIVIRGDLHSGTGNTRVLAQLASRLRARAETQT